MERRKLGRTDIEITPIGLGCWQFSGGKALAGKFWAPMDEATIDQVVKVSLEGGVNWFDTAEAYGLGASEEALAAALERAGKKPGEVVIATKWWPFFRRAKSIVGTIETRKRHLGAYPIDLHQVHQQHGAFSSHASEMEAMAELVRRGDIQAVGISNFSAKAMRTCHETLARRGLVLASNQMKYSLLDRKIEKNGVLETARELGVTIIAYSPLEQGLLTGKFHENPDLVSGPRKWMPSFRGKGLEKSRPVIEVLREIAKRHDATPAQVALNWLVSFHGETVVAIPGASKAHHAEQNVGSMSFRLDDDELRRIDEVSRPFM